MVTVYRFQVYFKYTTKKGGRLKSGSLVSEPFAAYPICLAALRSWFRYMKESYEDSYFEVMNYWVESSVEELAIDEMMFLCDCEKYASYRYASEYFPYAF